MREAPTFSIPMTPRSSYLAMLEFRVAEQNLCTVPIHAVHSFTQPTVLPEWYLPECVVCFCGK
jgi:hypothetical protein